MIRNSLPWLGAAALALVGLPAEAATQRFALLAGANDGGRDRATLRYAVSDAEDMAQVLQELGGVDVEDTLLLVEPGTDDLDEGFTRLAGLVEEARGRGDRAEVVVYYSGHSDAEGLLLAGERYGYDELRAALEQVPADVRLLVLDSCASGAMTRSKGGSFQPPFLLDQSVDVSGYAYLTSSSADEVAQEADQIGGSYFTHYLVSGLRGGADHSADGRVTLNEAYHFAYEETLARTERSVGGAQHATYDIQLNGTGDFVVTEIVAASAQLVLDERIHGRLFIRDAQGELVVELEKAAGRAITLGLAPGSYTVLVQQEDQAFESRVELVDGEPAKLVIEGFEPVALAKATARGGPDPSLPEVHVPFWIGIVPTNLGGRGDDVRIHHLDLSLGATSADRLSGFQAAIAANHIAYDARGLQAAVGANIADAITGVQAAVGPNIAREVHGLQLGVAPNIGGSVKGAQVGLVNIAGDADVQLGLVNFAKDADVSLGLVNVNLEGYNHLYTTFGFSDFATIGVTYGGKQLYSVVDFSPGEQMRLGMGLGWHQPIGGEGLFVDVDATASTYGRNLFGGAEPGMVARGRMVFGIGFRRLAFFIGPDVHVGIIEADSGPFDTSFKPLGRGDVAAGGQMGIRL